ncbi:hypothetical protein Hanom_Chr12g01125271 [Helianthus anomalus]
MNAHHVTAPSPLIVYYPVLYYTYYTLLSFFAVNIMRIASESEAPGAELTAAKGGVVAEKGGGVAARLMYWMPTCWRVK